MVFIDTNYFLRFLLTDDSSQHRVAKMIFKQAAEEKITVCTSVVVILELFLVLSSFYKKSKGEVINIMQAILDLQFIDLFERRYLQDALLIYKRSKIEFEDCYNLVYARARGATEFKTFDQKLLKIIEKE